MFIKHVPTFIKYFFNNYSYQFPEHFPLNRSMFREINYYFNE